jgi:hypothetical protein
MPRTRRRRTFWSVKDMKLLRRMAGRKSAARIARRLKRTLLAVRFKAHTYQISLALRRAR